MKMLKNIACDHLILVRKCLNENYIVFNHLNIKTFILALILTFEIVLHKPKSNLLIILGIK